MGTLPYQDDFNDGIVNTTVWNRILTGGTYTEENGFFRVSTPSSSVTSWRVIMNNTNNYTEQILKIKFNITRYAGGNDPKLSFTFGSNVCTQYTGCLNNWVYWHDGFVDYFRVAITDADLPLSSYSLTNYGNTLYNNVTIIFNVTYTESNFTLYTIIYNNGLPVITNVGGYGTDYNASNTIDRFTYYCTNSKCDTDYVFWGDPEDEIICFPDWSCSGYGSCNTSDLSPCNDVIDNNNCSVAYLGDYSEFSPQACNYCSADEEITGYSECVQHNQYVYVTDNNFDTCCNVTLLESDCLYGNQSSDSYPQSCSLFDYESGDLPSALFDGIVRILLTFVAFAGLIVMVLIGSWGFKKMNIKIKR